MGSKLLGRLCSYRGCDLKHYGHDLCKKHWFRDKNGLDMDDKDYTVTKYTTKAGYIMCRVRPDYYLFAEIPGSIRKNGGHKCIFEHRLLYMEKLGRALLSSEQVHHKNGVRTDNSIDNLEFWDTSQPPGQRVEDKIEWAIELIKRHCPEILK